MNAGTVLPATPSLLPAMSLSYLVALEIDIV
jgi:hypothetical protein